MAKHNHSERVCGIYCAPPKKNIDDVNRILEYVQENNSRPPSLKIELIDNSEKFDPKKLTKMFQ